MEREAVKSRLAKSIGHDPVTGMTEVEFHNGAIYQIDEMSVDEHAALRSSDSIGKHFNSLKASKTVRRVTTDAAPQQVSER